MPHPLTIVGYHPHCCWLPSSMSMVINPPVVAHSNGWLDEWWCSGQWCLITRGQLQHRWPPPSIHPSSTNQSLQQVIRLNCVLELPFAQGPYHHPISCSGGATADKTRWLIIEQGLCRDSRGCSDWIIYGNHTQGVRLIFQWNSLMK